MKGKTLMTDNFYKSIFLTEKLLHENTHLLGTLKRNRKSLLEEIVDKTLKRGKIIK